MEKLDKISLEDLQAINDAKANAAYMKVVAEKVETERVAAELQAKNIVLMAYLKYGLSGNDSIDNKGNIIRSEKPQETTTLAPEPTKKKKVA